MTPPRRSALGRHSRGQRTGRSPVTHTPATLLGAELCLGVCCLVPLYSQCRGDPSVCMFPTHIPEQCRNNTDPQPGPPGLRVAGPGAALGPGLSSFRTCVGEEAPAEDQAPVTKNGRACTQRLSTVTHTRLRIKTKITSLLFAFARSAFKVDLRLSLGVCRTRSEITTALKVVTHISRCQRQEGFLE